MEILIFNSLDTIPYLCVSALLSRKEPTEGAIDVEREGKKHTQGGFNV